MTAGVPAVSLIGEKQPFTVRLALAESGWRVN